MVPSFPRCSALKLSLLSPQVAEGSAGRELSPRKKSPSAASSAVPEEERCARRPPPEGAGSAVVGSEARPLERAAAGGWCRSCQAQLAELRKQAARLAAGGCPPNAPPVSEGCRLREGREKGGGKLGPGARRCVPRGYGTPGVLRSGRVLQKFQGLQALVYLEVPLRVLCAGNAVGCRDKETEIRSDFDGGSGAAQRTPSGHGERRIQASPVLSRLWKRTETAGGSARLLLLGGRETPLTPPYVPTRVPPRGGGREEAGEELCGALAARCFSGFPRVPEGLESFRVVSLESAARGDSGSEWIKCMNAPEVARCVPFLLLCFCL